MSSGTTAQDGAWKPKEQGEEARYIRQKEQEQLAAIRDQKKDEKKDEELVPDSSKDFEGGFGGQEDLEDRYATTSGDH